MATIDNTPYSMATIQQTPYTMKAIEQIRFQEKGFVLEVDWLIRLVGRATKFSITHSNNMHLRELFGLAIQNLVDGLSSVGFISKIIQDSEKVGIYRIQLSSAHKQKGSGKDTKFRINLKGPWYSKGMIQRYLELRLRNYLIDNGYLKNIGIIIQKGHICFSADQLSKLTNIITHFINFNFKKYLYYKFMHHPSMQYPGNISFLRQDLPIRVAIDDNKDDYTITVYLPGKNIYKPKYIGGCDNPFAFAYYKYMKSALYKFMTECFRIDILQTSQDSEDISSELYNMTTEDSIKTFLDVSPTDLQGIIQSIALRHNQVESTMACGKYMLVMYDSNRFNSAKMFNNQYAIQNCQTCMESKYWDVLATPRGLCSDIMKNCIPCLNGYIQSSIETTGPGGVIRCATSECSKWLMKISTVGVLEIQRDFINLLSPKTISIINKHMLKIEETLDVRKLKSPDSIAQARQVAIADRDRIRSELDKETLEKSIEDRLLAFPYYVEPPVLDESVLHEGEMALNYVNICPCCNTIVIKESGCPAMTCQKCMTPFCIRCGQYDTETESCSCLTGGISIGYFERNEANEVYTDIMREFITRE